MGRRAARAARIGQGGTADSGPADRDPLALDDAHLYLLFICPYTELNLKPDPTTSVETPRLWNWDVAEAFIGSDYERIGRYKEFQVSPQGEWVDLDIDRDNPKAQQGARLELRLRGQGRASTRRAHLVRA